MDANPRCAGSRFVGLERLAAGALVAVVVALGWMIVSAYQTDEARLASGGEVLVILALLVSALTLVSVVALLHTRA